MCGLAGIYQHNEFSPFQFALITRNINAMVTKLAMRGPVWLLASVQPWAWPEPSDHPNTHVPRCVGSAARVCVCGPPTRLAADGMGH